MIIEVLQICRREINFLLLAPKESFLDCTQPSTHRVIPRFRKKTSRDLQINSFLSQAAFFSLPVIPQHFLSSCHTGLRAGIQVNIDSLAAWIPGQARNDSKKTSPE